MSIKGNGGRYIYNGFYSVVPRGPSTVVPLGVLCKKLLFSVMTV